MKNLDTPAFPDSEGQIDYTGGLTKRERACIDLRIPESGDAELDALIEKARRQEMAAKAMQGLLASGPHDCDEHGVAHDVVLNADALLAELERTDG